MSYLPRHAIEIVPLTRAQANALVDRWHRHHKPVSAHRFAIGARVASEIVGAVIVGSPKAQALNDGTTFEVVRHSCRGGDPNVASKLLARATRSAAAQGFLRGVSYTRVDEDGACYRAAGWVDVALVKGREWTSGNKATRWLPGLYEPTTEIVDRIRWEWRSSPAARAGLRSLRRAA